jgi:mannose-1-phosphate guanylyltransferase/mannose-6-phosphate isomerase
MKALILAGGSGTRLWPLSRRNFPKQFLKLNGDKSLLQQTTERLTGIVPPESILVMTNDAYRFHVRSDLVPIFADAEQGHHRRASSVSCPDVPFHLILEPASRNTAPAIALGVKYCMDKLGCDREELIFVSPSDHVIKPVDRFREYLVRAEEIAKQGHIVTFGIKPSGPETGYGYIKASRKQEAGDFFTVEAFTEKPDAETARRYLEEGVYFWNSGMFMFSIGTILDELGKFEPRIGSMLDMTLEGMISAFKDMPDISIDYAVMEKSRKVVTLPMDLFWNDIGSWDSLFEVLEKDENSNAKSGDVVTVDTRDTMIMADKRLISTIGLEDCLIVETDDAVLVAKRGEAQKVREVVNKLRKDGRKEVSEHLTTYRPWGSYTVLEEGVRYKIKRIVVNPCEKLSFQVHYHRSEHWVVVKGTAKVTIGEREVLIHENESAYVPKSTAHRLENPGKIPLEIIEVQNGEYVGEDDIVRMDDVYGRHEAV